MISDTPTRFTVFTNANLDSLQQFNALPAKQQFETRVVASVLPFRVNSYVVDELIDWERVPADPVFQLVFPQAGMLERVDYEAMAALHKRGAEASEIRALADDIRTRLNPHPGGQRDLNVPFLEETPVEGLQHKYRETVLFFPAAGQTCHSYCTFCFRWAQFIGDSELKFAQKDADVMHAYLRAHTEVSDLLVTGGDPMVMRTKRLRAYLEPLLDSDFDHIRTIRIGSKSLTFWPQRYVSDADADDLLDLLRELTAAGKHVAFMSHFEHAREFSTPIAREAIARVRATGAVIRSQAPLVRHINDSSEVWAELWREQISLGIVPYYMFVERDTGARNYFEVPLVRAHEVYRDAIAKVGGLARHARGPVMSCEPGKVEVTGITEIAGERVFALRFLQARNPDWVGRPFFARFDPKATWMTDLVPAFGEERFFFEDDLDALKRARMELLEEAGQMA